MAREELRVKMKLRAATKKLLPLVTSETTLKTEVLTVMNGTFWSVSAVSWVKMSWAEVKDEQMDKRTRATKEMNMADLSLLWFVYLCFSVTNNLFVPP